MVSSINRPWFRDGVMIEILGYATGAFSIEICMLISAAMLAGFFSPSIIMRKSLKRGRAVDHGTAHANNGEKLSCSHGMHSKS